jgi:putative membrane protein
MLYLPRLFVYHAAAERGSVQSETFKVMERRLLKAIMTPAMIATWVLGLTLAWQGGWFKAGWLHGKLLLVLALSAVHGMLAGHVRRFARDGNVRPTRYFRILNEVPTVLMIAIVILVIVKPF